MSPRIPWSEDKEWVLGSTVSGVSFSLSDEEGHVSLLFGPCKSLRCDVPLL